MILFKLICCLLYFALKQYFGGRKRQIPAENDEEQRGISKEESSKIRQKEKVREKSFKWTGPPAEALPKVYQKEEAHDQSEQ